MHAILTKVATEEGFQDPLFIVEGGTEKGDNYAGVIHWVKITEGQDGGQKSSLSVVVKSQPENEGRRKTFQTSQLFKNESVFYNEIIPVFIKFQRDKGLTNSLAPSHPRCLWAGDLFVLEDQNPHGFVKIDRRDALDYPHCLLIMKELGRLHAMSFALRDQRLEELKHLVASLDERVFFNDAPVNVREYFTFCANRAVEKFEEYAQNPLKEKYLSIIKDFTEDVFQKLVDAVNSDNVEPYAVIIHGDCSINNTLFKYYQSSTVPERACLLDFQLARYASPACDLSYLLFCCTDKTMRDKHYTQLLQEYHCSLGMHLAALGSNVDNLFPWAALELQMKTFGHYGIGMAMVNIPMTTANAEDVSDLDEVNDEANGSLADQLIHSPSENNSCWERLCDVIVDVIDLGYMK